MKVTGEYLMTRLDSVLQALRNGRTGAAIGPHAEWTIVTQKIEGRPTGKLVLACDDALALAEFKRLAEDADHIITDGPEENTLLVTPAQPQR
jgi:hypothetical protein